MIEHNGMKMRMIDWAKLKDIPYKALDARINREKWTIERALETPYKRHHNSITWRTQTNTLSDWSRLTNIPRNVLWQRFFKCGWDAEKTLFTPYIPLYRRFTIAAEKLAAFEQERLKGGELNAHRKKI